MCNSVVNGFEAVVLVVCGVVNFLVSFFVNLSVVFVLGIVWGLRT